MPTEIAFPEAIETERLVLRRYLAEHTPSLYALVESNRDRLMQDFPQMAKGLRSTDEARLFIEEKAAQWNARKLFCFGIWRREELIGQLQVKNIVWDVPSAELSYFIGSSRQRQGFASEAIAAMTRMAFEQLEFLRLFVRVLPANQESIALARKLRFQYEGLHRNAYRCGSGKLHDVQYFSLVPDDFRKMNEQGSL